MFYQKIRPGLTWQSNRHSATALIWAPFAETVYVEKVKTRKQYSLYKASFGYWEGTELPLQPGDLYHVMVDGKILPDPASLFQPHGVHGPSEIVDLTEFQWGNPDWQEVDVQNLVVYELHVGTFSHSGNFFGVIDHLPYLKELGVNALELMPVVSFPGARNWGYDGVFPFAVHPAYGGILGLQQLVDACHSYGIAVILDVVYNHLGPDGNYLHEFGPYFTDKYKTPWGDALNFDDAWSDGVRHYFIQNALMWFRDFHIDGLRLDAVHAIKDFGASHFLAQLKDEVEVLNHLADRNHFLIAECDLNDVRFINSSEKGGYNMDAQWCDEFHHALHTLVTEEKSGYYADFSGLDSLIKAFNHGYVYDGIYSPFRKKTFGNKTTGQPGYKFVVFAQNHDQVGNRLGGERLTVLTSFDLQKIWAAVYLLSPFTPLLFMGEEYGETAPFLYFTDHQDPGLADSVRRGRKEEFREFIRDDADFPDPQAESTFLKSKLSGIKGASPEQQYLFRWYKTLIRLRQSLGFWNNDPRRFLQARALSPDVMVVEGKKEDDEIRMFFNFGKQPFENNDYGLSEVILNSKSESYGGNTELQNTYSQTGSLIIPAETFVLIR